jgi:hypothetical protein
MTLNDTNVLDICLLRKKTRDLPIDRLLCKEQAHHWYLSIFYSSNETSRIAHCYRCVLAVLLLCMEVLSRCNLSPINADNNRHQVQITSYVVNQSTSTAMFRYNDMMSGLANVLIVIRQQFQSCLVRHQQRCFGSNH